MGTVTVDNDVDRDYWKDFLAYLAGVPPKIEAVRDYRVTLTSEGIDQATLEPLIALWQRNKARSHLVEVSLPSLEEREAAVKLDMQGRAPIDEGRADENRLP